MSAVAKAQSMSPSAVSQPLAQLERETKVSLLERAGRGVVLTGAAVQLTLSPLSTISPSWTGDCQTAGSKPSPRGRTMP